MSHILKGFVHVYVSVCVKEGWWESWKAGDEPHLGQSKGDENTGKNEGENNGENNGDNSHDDGADNEPSLRKNEVHRVITREL